MDIATQKLQLIQQIATIQDITLIQKIVDVLSQFQSLYSPNDEMVLTIDDAIRLNISQ